MVLFWDATTLLALHAAVDSFVAPEPETGPLDHLLRGSATLAVLALAAGVYPRLAAGGQTDGRGGARRARARDDKGR
jgi:hypothetical protein